MSAGATKLPGAATGTRRPRREGALVEERAGRGRAGLRAVVAVGPDVGLEILLARLPVRLRLGLAAGRERRGPLAGGDLLGALARRLGARRCERESHPEQRHGERRDHTVPHRRVLLVRDRNADQSGTEAEILSVS